jgi:hypothetical protein
MAATAVLEFMSSKGMSSPISMPLGMSVHKREHVIIPILEPSVCKDDGLEGWTVVRRRNWSPASGKRSHDPANPGFQTSTASNGPGEKQGWSLTGASPQRLLLGVGVIGRAR